MGKVTVWNNDAVTDIASSSDCDSWNILLFHKHTYIRPVDIKIGLMVFSPGSPYSKIGTGKKTSSGFTQYHGEPLFFQGVYDNYILFTKKEMPNPEAIGYAALFYAFKMLPKHNALITLNYVGSPRLINLE